MATATRVYMHTVPVRTTGSLDYRVSYRVYTGIWLIYIVYIVAPIVARIWKDTRYKTEDEISLHAQL